MLSGARGAAPELRLVGAGPERVILAHEKPFRIGKAEFRPATREVSFAGETSIVEPRVMQMLVALHRANGNVVSKDDLGASCWEGRIVGEDAINRVASRLRAVAEKQAGDQFRVETITKVGYRLVSAAPGSAQRVASNEYQQFRVWLILGALAGLLIMGLVITRYAGRKPGGVPTIAVSAADPSGKDLAHDLLVNLGNLPSVQEGSVRLLAGGGDPSDLVFEASTAETTKGGANLLLLSGKDHMILWSKEFGGESRTAADLKQQMAYSAGRVLECAVEALEPGAGRVEPQTLKLYLTGCSRFAEAGDADLSAVIPVFEQVVKDAPAFKAGWARLLLAESVYIFSLVDPTAAEQQRLARHIAQARRLDPDMPEAIIAQATLLPWKAYENALRLLDRAQARSPRNAAVLVIRANELMRVGRMNDAVADAYQASRLDPTSPDALRYYVLTLAYSGRIDAARSELRRAERLWPGTGSLRDLQYAFDLRFGDPKTLLDTDEFKRMTPGWQMYLRTKADPTPANIDRMMAFLHDLYERRGVRPIDITGHAQSYGEFHREDDLYRLISRLPPGEDYSIFTDTMFRPALRKFRQDPRFMIVAKEVGLVDYWTKSGKWPDFCFEPGQPYDCRKEAAKVAARPLTLSR